jgi:ABC-type phosphate transport system substrate-binding protein
MRGAVVRLAVIAAILLSVPAHQSAQEPAFVVIVNKANPVKSLTLVELRRLFMKQTRMWPHAESVVPVDWDATSPLREAFAQRVLGRSVREMADFWVQQSITQGLTPPSTQRSTRAMLRFVASVNGAIGYVPAGEADDTVSVIKVTGLP